MNFAGVVISSREWVLPAVAFLVIATLLLMRTYLRAPANRTLRTACAFLKLLGLAALAACLVDPLWTSQRARPGANYFAVVADNSQGLNIKDRGETQTRAGQLTNWLAPRNATWLDQLDQEFQLRRYSFDSRLQSTRDFGALDFKGRASSLNGALRTLVDRFHGQPLAGVLLFTDGNATDAVDGKLDVTGLPPIYPVVIGREETINDIALRKVTTSQTAFEDQPVTVQADVSVGGYRGELITAELRDGDGTVVQQLHQRAGRDGETFRFQLRPEGSGILFYQLRVAAQPEFGQLDQPETATEATLANNTRTVVVDRGKGPYRLLYVSGRPNWEFKFLNRALAEDRQVELLGLIRIAKREKSFGRMEFRNRPGESANPLFRGFDRTTDDTEGYDEPVLKWLLPSDRDTNWISRGFPNTAAELFRYHAVIIDDLEADFFTRDQMSLLQKFVSERGGGFLMLGGAESFAPGKYEHTAIGEMMPVYLDYQRDAAPVTNLRLSLTREGWLQPWVRLRDNEVSERARLTDMPSLQVLNQVRDVKPGASVIAEVQDEAGAKHPALVAQRFGNGRVGALLVGDLWRWGLRDESTRSDQDKAWRQMIRWLIADVPGHIQLLAEPQRDDPNQAMVLRVRARDKEFKPLDNAAVKITVSAVPNKTDGTNTPTADPITVRLNAEPALAGGGLYEANYLPRSTGGYLAEAVVVDADGDEVGRAQTGWVADPAAEEFRSLKPNVALLENLARQTGGAIVAATSLDSFAQQLPNREAPITENVTTPLWNKPLVFLLALACFVSEWGLRRWKGLP